MQMHFNHADKINEAMAWTECRKQGFETYNLLDFRS